MDFITGIKKEKLLTFFALLMIIFGIAETVTGVRHEFYGLVTTADTITKVVGFFLGLCYFFSGVLLLTFKRKPANIAFILLCIDVAGRLLMVITGMYPVDSTMQIVGITGGTSIAFLFAVYVYFKRQKLN